MASGNDGKIIHVLFGGKTTRKPGRRRPRPRDKASRAQRDELEAAAAILQTDVTHPVEPTRDVYTRPEVEKLLGTSAARLRTLQRYGVISPSGRRGARAAYTFQDLIAIRTAIGLLSSGVTPREVARAIEALRVALPRVRRPLQELRVSSQGAKVVVRSTEGSFEPTTGQMTFNFEVRDLREDVVRVLRPAVKQHRARAAFELYRRASELDEDPKTIDEAARLYREAIDTDPLLAIAYTNLGNILFRKGADDAAEALYSKALAIDPRQPEAKYNLGYLMLERQELDVAIRYFQGAIEADPKFADAYFNLAMAYEDQGDRRTARKHWKMYLELEPRGTWADIARQHLA